MKKKLLLQDFCDYIVQHEGVSPQEADVFMRAFFEVVEQGLLEDKFVKIKGFGTFKLVAVSERESVNINTGERFQISGHTKVSFTPDNAMKELVNRPFAHFETVDLSDETDTSEFDTIDQEMEAEEEEEDLLQDEVEEEETEDAHAPSDDSVQANNTENTDEPSEESTQTLDTQVPQTEEQATSEEDTKEETEQPHTSSEIMDEEKKNNDNDQQLDQIAQPTPIVPEIKATSAESEATARIRIERVEEEGDAESSPEPVVSHNEDVTPEIPEKNPEEIVVTAPQSITSNTGDYTSNTMGYEYCEVPSRKKINWWKRSVIAFLALVVMTLCYFAGYYRILCPCILFCPQEEQPVSEKVVPVKVEKVQKQVSPRTAPKNQSSTKNEKVQQSVKPENKPSSKELQKSETLNKGNEKEVTEKKVQTSSTPKEKAEPQPRPKSHIVQKGDNLSKISRKYYGSDAYISKILKYNNLKDADNIAWGMKLQLP